MRIVQFPEFPGRERGRISNLSFGVDSRSLAAVWRIDEALLMVRWWDLARQEEVAFEVGASLGEDDATPPDPALSPDHRFLARVANERGGVQWIQFFDRSDERRRERSLTAWEYAELGGYPECFNHQTFEALAFSPDGRSLVAAVGGGDPDDEEADAPRVGIYRWSVPAILRGRGPRSGGRLMPDPGFFLPMPRPDVFGWQRFGRGLAFAQGGGLLAAGLWNARVLGWQLPSGRPLPAPRLKRRRRPRAWRLGFSPDGRTLAVADEVVTLYEAATGSPRVVLPPGPAAVAHEAERPGPNVFDLAFDPSGRLLATACGDRLVRLWDGATGAARGEVDCGVGGVTAVGFSPDGGLCAAGGREGRVAVWELGE
jgi:WD40 repeat protein